MLDPNVVRNNLIQLRKANNLTQEDVADELKMQRGTYATYEQGRARPNIDTLVQLSKFYNTSLENLIGEGGTE